HLVDPARVAAHQWRLRLRARPLAINRHLPFSVVSKHGRSAVLFVLAAKERKAPEGVLCVLLRPTVSYFPYSASVTCSNHVAALPLSSASCIARCVIEFPGAAPCQCRSSALKTTVSPGFTVCTGPPAVCTRPTPARMCSVCPRGCVCHAV